MRILLLGPERDEFRAFLESFGDEVVRTDQPLPAHQPLLPAPSWIVSYGYRHLIAPSTLAQFPGRVINLHISHLPWNRGADPNLWSFLEDTPKGVSIHQVDEGLDTGPLFAQREVAWVPGDTLTTSYERLSMEIEALFREIWPQLRAGGLHSHPQPSGGSLHRARDRARVLHWLTRGWDTPVETLIGKARRG